MFLFSLVLNGSLATAAQETACRGNHTTRNEKTKEDSGRIPGDLVTTHSALGTLLT
jgi:hypothetical protein